ncbi:MAG: zinc ribbon domain-containing protein [Clostridia bacterium]
MFICKICGNKVEAGQAFCGKCGADVVENYETVCPTCGSKNGSGSHYCAKCGGILGVLSKPACAVCGFCNLPGAKFCVSCGAPIVASKETHTDSDVLDARFAKKKLDMMERERMQAVDREIASKRKVALEENEKAIKEVESEREKNNAEFEHQKEVVEKYRKKLNELGSEDLEQLKKVSAALKNYAIYYADPYTEIDEDRLDNESYICPSCGTINPLEVTECSHCGRNKARATLLLAKGKIKQSPPIKRKKDIIPAPEQDLEAKHSPTFDEFEKEIDSKTVEKKEVVAEKQEKPADFSGHGQQAYGGYPYPPYGAPFGYPMQGGFGGSAPLAPGFYNSKPGDAYQMPPIVQPVAFVPYLTQEQPLMQYMPTDVNQQGAQKQTVAPQQKMAQQAVVSGKQTAQQSSKNNKI